MFVYIVYHVFVYTHVHTQAQYVHAPTPTIQISRITASFAPQSLVYTSVDKILDPPPNEAYRGI